MKNITLSIDEETLRAVRKLAAERDTTVNALVRAYLEQLAKQTRRKKDVLKRMRRIAEKGGMEVGPKSWTRDDVHER
jgi:hypothetical protein